MLAIDLSGRRALVAGIADGQGLGFAIARALAQAGASVCAATWPPAHGVLRTLLERGKLDAARALPDGRRLDFERIYPLDADFDSDADLPAELRANRRYRDLGDVSVDGLAARLRADFGDGCLDVVVHSLANAPEVQRPLLETSRAGYLAAVGTSAYSFVSLAQRLGPLVRPGGVLLGLTYLAAERVVAGYGGGMSSAKAALESDARVLAHEAGRRFGLRVNLISAGPWPSRAASAIGRIEQVIEQAAARSPLPQPIDAAEVGAAAAFLASPLASGITGSVLHVDKGLHAMAPL